MRGGPLGIRIHQVGKKAAAMSAGRNAWVVKRVSVLRRWQRALGEKPDPKEVADMLTRAQEHGIEAAGTRPWKKKL